MEVEYPSGNDCVAALGLTLWHFLDLLVETQPVYNPMLTFLKGHWFMGYLQIQNPLFSWFWNCLLFAVVIPPWISMNFCMNSKIQSLGV